METSSHSEIRFKQRGISQEQVDLIVAYGEKYRKPGGAWEYRLLRKDKARIITQLKRLMRLVENAAGKGVLISGEGEEVITTYHLLRR